MGQVENGRLYMSLRYRSRSQINEAEKLKKLTDYFLYYCNHKSTLNVLLIFNKVVKTEHKNFILFIHLLSSSFFLARHNLKSILCLQILNMPNKCPANLLNSYLFYALCKLQVESYAYGLKTVPKGC